MNFDTYWAAANGIAGFELPRLTARRQFLAGHSPAECVERYQGGDKLRQQRIANQRAKTAPNHYSQQNKLDDLSTAHQWRQDR